MKYCSTHRIFDCSLCGTDNIRKKISFESRESIEKRKLENDKKWRESEERKLGANKKHILIQRSGQVIISKIRTLQTPDKV